MRDFDNELADLLAVMDADPIGRHLIQPQFHKLLDEMRAAGLTPPQGLDTLDTTLIDEGVEADFDNFPV